MYPSAHPPLLLTSIIMCAQNPAEFRFIKNRGQLVDMQGALIPDQEYYVNNGPATTYFSTNGFDVVYARVDDDTATMDTLWRVNGNFLNSRTNLVITPKDTSTFIYNYYLPQCPNGVTNVHAYSGIRVQDLYTGISLEYNSTSSGYSMLFILNPERMPETIDIEFQGQDSMHIDTSGNLHVYTGLGEVIYPIPNAWYDSNYVSVSYTKTGNIISFSTANYNGSDTLYMEIGEIFLKKQLCSRNLIWSTYFGGSNNDEANDIAVNKTTESIYITGFTESKDFPVIPGDTFTYNHIDIIISKFNKDNELIWSNYYGSSLLDYGNSVTYGNGYVYICGRSSGNDLPLHYNAGQFGQNFGNGVIARFYENNGLLDWSTKYGGKGPIPYGGELTAIDYYNNKIFVVGYCLNDSVPTLPLTDSSYYSDNGESGIILIFKDDCSRYYCTRYGVSDTMLRINNITHDSYGNIYLTGVVNKSSTLPIIQENSNSYTQSGVFNGGMTDGFIAKLGPNRFAEFALLWSTYFGGNKEDELTSIIIVNEDSMNKAYLYLGGSTKSDTFPTFKSNTAQSYFDSTYYNNNLNDMLIAKFSKSGKQIWTTYYGGNCRDDVTDLVYDSINGRIYILGTTSDLFINDIELVDSSIMYFKADEPLSSYTDGVIIAVDTSTRRIFSTLYGGTETDVINAGCMNDSLLYIVGYTSTKPDFPKQYYEGFPLCKETSTSYFQAYSADSSISIFISKFKFGIPTGISSISRIEKAVDIEINSFPNPTKDYLNVEIRGKLNGRMNIAIFDVSGRNINVYFDNKIDYAVVRKILVGDLPSGLYVIKVKINGYTKADKIIIQ